MYNFFKRFVIKSRNKTGTFDFELYLSAWRSIIPFSKRNVAFSHNLLFRKMTGIFRVNHTLIDQRIDGS